MAEIFRFPSPENNEGVFKKKLENLITGFKFDFIHSGTEFNWSTTGSGIQLRITNLNNEFNLETPLNQNQVERLADAIIDYLEEDTSYTFMFIMRVQDRFFFEPKQQ